MAVSHSRRETVSRARRTGRPRAAQRRARSSPWPGTAPPSRSPPTRWPRSRRTRAVVEALADDPQPHYGISTGFGALATRHIPVERRTQLQRSLIRSHAAGSGPEVEREVVRALMLLRISTLATGRTGIRPETLQAYAALLNAGITPVVHEYGSLGCSGDLAPLAHCALALMGEGVVRDRDRRAPAGRRGARGGRDRAGDAGREGGPGADQRHRRHARHAGAGPRRPRPAADHVADITAAMSVEGLLGTDDVFADDLQRLRPHPGQLASAANLRALMAGSEIRESHRTEECTRVQDAYSLRCSPQVAGGCPGHRWRTPRGSPRSSWPRRSTTRSITLDGRVESNGNFHGAPIAYVLDFLAIAVADLASIAERRTDRFLDRARNNGLTAFLADDPGVDSGQMIAQYTQAAIVSELKRLAVPASVDSIPSSAMQEDHVSMGWAGGPQAAPGRRRADPGAGHRAAHRRPRHRAARPAAPRPRPPAAVIAALRAAGAPGPGPDRWLAPEIETAVRLRRRRRCRRRRRVRHRPPQLTHPPSPTARAKRAQKQR